MLDPDTDISLEPQDEAEIFDETHQGEDLDLAEGEPGDPDLAPDVFDVTSQASDSDEDDEGPGDDDDLDDEDDEDDLDDDDLDDDEEEDDDLDEEDDPVEAGPAPIAPEDRVIRGSGARAEHVIDSSDPDEEDRLDHGLEETFPASDPVSAKHIS